MPFLKLIVSSFQKPEEKSVYPTISPGESLDVTVSQDAIIALHF